MRRRGFGKKIQQLQKKDFLPYEHAHIEADLKEFKYWTYPKGDGFIPGIKLVY
ncbi:hypothetical protein LEP1GSC020_4339 [Leptospira interrogans serovar Grippotyphosa str. 2006006986]|nr:hypothetical protein LEP1GSC009_1141 [Leptospira interrogans serovar Grippotyphosa str. Andaman]EKP84284.1 hypothetical protein LEP1GSC020_4339 [Leptospira interrogans serovar Grippotyphosa str. 2006006986]